MDGCLIILSFSTLIVNGLKKLLFSDLFYDIKFLLVHTYVSGSLFLCWQCFCLMTRLEPHLKRKS
jgi:hypothetical protein